MAAFSSPNSDRLPIEGCARWADFAAQHHLPDAVRVAMDHALAEHLQNIVDHSGATQVEILFECAPKAVLAVVRDDGQAFDPTAAPEVDTTTPIEERPVGGLGIHMMRRLCNRLTYQRRGGINRLELSKALDAGGSGG